MAIATESGYGAFLPTYENELVNREVLRGQMTKQASYLTEMDTMYAQLEEKKREFDVGLASQEKYNEAQLAQRASEFDRNLSLNWAQQATNSYSAHGQVSAWQNQLNQEQSQYDQTRTDQQNAAADQRARINSTWGSTTNNNPTSSDYQDIWTGVGGMSSSGTMYNQYGQVVQGAGNYDYSSDDYSSSDYSSLGDFSSYGGGSGAVEGQTYSLGNQDYYSNDANFQEGLVNESWF